VRSFSEHFYDETNFLVEYRHKTAEGLSKPSLQAHNGKNPFRMNGKNIHTVGPYKPLEADLHKVGKILMGDRLLAILSDYNINFEPGNISAIKNSPFSIQMFNNKQGQPSAKVIKKEAHH
jgi:hypothetical protein